MPVNEREEVILLEVSWPSTELSSVTTARRVRELRACIVHCVTVSTNIQRQMRALRRYTHVLPLHERRSKRKAWALLLCGGVCHSKLVGMITWNKATALTPPALTTDMKGSKKLTAQNML